MTIQAVNPRLIWEGNDAATSISLSVDAVPIHFKANSHIKVKQLVVATSVITDMAEGVDYTLAGGPESGIVTRSAGALPSGYQWAIYREQPYAQEVDLLQGGDFSSADVESLGDIATLMVQEISERFDRALKASVFTDPDTILELPAPSASRIIGWNEDADALVNYELSDLDPGLVPAFWAPPAGVLGTTSAASARSALGALAEVMPRRAITGADTVVASDWGGIIEVTSGTFSLAFTAVATLGAGFWCVIYNSGTGTVTLDPDDTEQIDGANTTTLGHGQSRLVHCSGAAFETVLLGDLAGPNGSVVDATPALFNGTSGKSLKGGAADYADFNENGSPDNPAANDARLYAKDDGSGKTVMAYRGNAGTETLLRERWSLSFVAYAVSNAAAVTGPAAIEENDLLVLLDRAESAKAAPTAVVPSGFTQIANTDVGVVRQLASYKVADGSEASASITGMDGDTTDCKILAVFRPNFTPGTITVSTPQAEGTTGDPAAQSINVLAGTPPLIAFACYGHEDNDAVRTFRPIAKDGEIANELGANMNNAYLAWKAFDLPGAAIAVDADDADDQNVLQTFYIAVEVI